MTLKSKIVNFVGNQVLNSFIRQNKKHFFQKEGHTHIMNSILYNYFPLKISEYLFGINEQGEFKYFPGLDEKRKKCLENVLLNKSEENILEMIISSHSAIIPENSEDYLLFHAHPEITFLDYNSEESSFSNADKVVSKKRTVGLIEFARPDKENYFSFLSRLSLCWNGHEKSFLEYEITFQEKGICSLVTKNKSFECKVPQFISINKEAHEEFSKKINTTPMHSYLWKYATKVI